MNAVPKPETAESITNPDSLYTPLACAVRELRKRREDAGLERKVAEFLDGRKPPHFRDEPRALHWPTLASPNIWMHEVHAAADQMGIMPLVFEYQRDKFHPGNETKLHLARMRFFLGRDRHGSPRTRCLNAVDVNDVAGKAFERMHVRSGQRFIDFHHQLLRGFFPHTEVRDMSDWIESFPTIIDFYDAYLSLCIRDCVLMESFRAEGSERGFTEHVVVPAFHRALERFGVKPLIVALEPVSGPLDLYWYSYPAEVLPVVEAALNGGMREA
jgi:hypothetical protein